MPVNDELGKRMKENYENRAKTSLLRRVPVAIRIDGKAFHTFTRGFDKPFDAVLMASMRETMKSLCENIQGCVFGYTQSDEITLILCDYQTLTTSAWFDYQVEKMCSVAASMATLYFNRAFDVNFDEWGRNTFYDWDEGGTDLHLQDKTSMKLLKAYDRAYKAGALFDARCFNIPKEEVTNLIYWRQLDATRNSIQMVGQAYFSQTQLQGKSCAMIQEMLFNEKGINWNDFPTDCKRGSCCVKTLIQDPRVDPKDGYYPISKWIIDRNIPIFKNEGRLYVEAAINFDEED